jgi:hypothetical protein
LGKRPTWPSFINAKRVPDLPRLDKQAGAYAAHQIRDNQGKRPICPSFMNPKRVPDLPPLEKQAGA